MAKIVFSLNKQTTLFAAHMATLLSYFKCLTKKTSFRKKTICVSLPKFRGRPNSWSHLYSQRKTWRHSYTHMQLFSSLTESHRKTVKAHRSLRESADTTVNNWWPQLVCKKHFSHSYLFSYLPIYLSIYLFICLFTYLFIYLIIYLPVTENYLSTYDRKLSSYLWLNYITTFV